MNRNAGASGLLADSDERQGAVSVSETNWGYIVRKGARARKLAGMGEVAAVFACLMLGTFAYAPWVLPVSINDVVILPYKISATIMFFVFSALSYLMSRRGLSFEVQIDTRQRVVRTARVQMSSRLIGDYVYHADGAQRLVRNAMLEPRTAEEHYNSLEWLYGGTGLESSA